MEDNITKIIIGILTLITAIIGTTIYLKIKKNKVNQENIDISGNNNKVIGRDDNSK